MARRRLRRRRAALLAGAAGLLLLLASLLSGLILAQRGVAELAGPDAPIPPLAAGCAGDGCWLSLLGRRTEVRAPDLTAWPYNVMTWLSRKSMSWR